MCSLTELEDLFPLILSFLERRTQMKTARCLSRSWYHAVAANRCMCLRLVRGWLFKWMGHFALTNGVNNAPHQRRTPKRTRGHLPEPRMDYHLEGTVKFRGSDDGEWDLLGILFIPAISTGGTYGSLVALDLGADSEFCRKNGDVLRKANLSCLGSLKQVTAKGAKTLTDLSLPSSLLGLDVRCCPKLKQVLFSMVQNKESNLECCQIQSLNLSGCRSLKTLGGPATWSSNLQEADLSSCTRVPTQDIANLLKATTCLKSLSLRYIATDPILLALAQSSSATTSLLWVDVAFSTDLTDQGVTTLFEKSPHLERINLRGCRMVSSHCYNQTPILLQQRLAKEGGICGCACGSGCSE